MATQPACVIFGGSGWIGTHLANHFASTRRFSPVILADIREPPPWVETQNTRFIYCDVRKPITSDLAVHRPQWIYNLAAVHREPGHTAEEYFQTNLNGAQHVCQFANRVDCRNMFFASTIAVYGPTTDPIDEYARLKPVTPYGQSKHSAELSLEAWYTSHEQRRLVICRPGVVYGPHDPGNILRMIHAIKRGYFLLPNRRDLYKSYAYIYGLLDSIDFMMQQTDRYICYNYVETPTESVRQLVGHVKSLLRSHTPTVAVPTNVLLLVAHAVSFLTNGASAIHPARVRKAATSTHIVPRVLQEKGFPFRYDFPSSLEHWQSRWPDDFGARSTED